MALTNTTIRNAKPLAKPYKLTDEKGLFLLVQPSGGMLWRFKFRVDGRDEEGNPKKVEKKLGLGTYPDVTLKDARDLRDDASVERFKKLDEPVQDEFRGQLTAFRNLYAFLSQIMPYYDEGLEQLYAFLRNLSPKLPQPGDGTKFTLDDDVALKFFRLQQMGEGTIDLSDGEADPLKGPTDVGTAREKEADVALSTLVRKLNERFGTDFTEADQLFFDSVRATAERDEKIVEAAKANTEANFTAFFSRVLDDLFIQRMEGNDEIFNRVMSDKQFRTAAQEHLAREVYGRIRHASSESESQRD